MLHVWFVNPLLFSTCASGSPLSGTFTQRYPNMPNTGHAPISKTGNDQTANVSQSILLGSLNPWPFHRVIKISEESLSYCRDWWGHSINGQLAAVTSVSWVPAESREEGKSREVFQSLRLKLNLSKCRNRRRLFPSRPRNIPSLPYLPGAVTGPLFFAVQCSCERHTNHQPESQSSNVPQVSSRQFWDSIGGLR